MKHSKLFRLVAGVALIAFATTGFAANAKMSGKVKGHANSGGNHELSVIVHYHTKPNQAEDNRLNGLEPADQARLRQAQDAGPEDQGQQAR